jgi:hypothetical protein
MITTLLGDLRSTARRRHALRVSLAVVVAVLVATGTGVAATERLDSGNGGPPIEDADATAYAVVVADATDGVGAYNVTVSLAESSAARITGFEPHETADLSNTTISADGSRVTARVALMNTTNTGRVRIGSLTLSGADAESANTTLTVNALGDEQGDPYDADTRVRVVSATESIEDEPADPNRDDDNDGSDDDAPDRSDEGSEQSDPADSTEGGLETTADADDVNPAGSDASTATAGTDGDAGTATDPATVDDLGTSGSDSVTDADSSPVPVSGMGVFAALVALGVLVLVRRWSD